MSEYKNKLEALKRSKFRSSFKLNSKELCLAADLKKVQEDCVNIIYQRLAPENPKNDGKQTPYSGHPVFVAQHATATCCRTCLSKWHHIEKYKHLSKDEMMYICKLIRTWIFIQTHSS